MKKGENEENEPRNSLDLLSRVNDDLVDLPLDADIFSYIARTLQKITPTGTIILVNSLDRKKNEVVLQAFEGLGSYLPRVDEILGRPLKGISFSVPEPTMIPMRGGECIELFGGAKELTFGVLPEETCQKLEALPFFGTVYSAGISWKGELHGAVTFILPPGMHLTNPGIVSQFIRRIAGYLQRRETELALQESEEWLRFALGAAEIGVWSWNLATNVQTHTNSGLLFGYTSAELEDYFRHLDTNSHPDDTSIDAVMKNIITASLCGDGTTSEFERRIRAKDGTWRWSLVRGKVVTCDTAGKPLLLMGTIRDITERKRAEEALRASEEKYTKAFLSVPDAITISELESGRYIEVNDAATRIFGYSRDELMGNSTLELGIWRNKKDRDRLIAEVRKHGKVSQFEVVNWRKSGESFNAMVNADFISLGNATYLIAIIHDITKRKRVELALRESENKFATVFLSSPVALTLVSATDGTFVDVNDAFVSSIGYSRDEVIGKTSDALGIFTDKNERERMLFSLRDQPCTYGMELKCRIKTGEIRTCLFSSSLILMGEKPYILSTIEDITNRKQAEEALRRSEERYRSLSESAQDLIFIIDRNDNVVYVNSYSQQMLKKPLEDIIGKPRKGLFPKSDSARQYQNLQRVFTTGIPHRVESQVPISGQARWQDTHLMPLRSADGTIYAVMGISRDITEQKALHDAVTLANKKLNLLSSITRHDIINQLSALNGYLDLSRDILHDPMKLEEYIIKQQNIARTIEAQIRFTKDYQDLGIKAPEWQNVHDSVVAAKESLSLREIAVEMDSSTLEVYADPLLVRVFYNLIDNALRYGGERMSAIRISSQESSRGLVIVCEDDGVGIPADKKEAIFNRGYFKHTGFGLFLSREILGITGITITENGTPGKGARFEITVPKGMYRFTGADAK